MPPVTSKVPGNGTSTISYTIPGSGLDVETVRVAVDATGAGGAVTATVTITDQSGVVIATKPQSATIAAGATGSATWALRLDDEAATTSAGGIQFDVSPQSGNFFDLETSGPSFLGLTIQDNGPGGLYIRSTNNGFLLIDASQQLYIHGSKVSIHSDNDTEVFLGSTFDRFAVFNHLNQVIFEVDEDGTIHGKASVGAITWDLP